MVMIAILEFFSYTYLKDIAYYYIIDPPFSMYNLILIEDTRFFRYEKSFDCSPVSCGF